MPSTSKQSSGKKKSSTASSGKLGTWFISGEAIDYDVLCGNIRRLLGKEATVKCWIHEDKETHQRFEGFQVTAFESPTAAIIQELKDLTRKKAESRQAMLPIPSGTNQQHFRQEPRQDTGTYHSSFGTDQYAGSHSGKSSYNFQYPRSQCQSLFGTSLDSGYGSFGGGVSYPAGLYSHQTSTQPSPRTFQPFSSEPLSLRSLSLQSSSLASPADSGADTAIPDPYDPNTDNPFESPLPKTGEPGNGYWGREKPSKPGPPQDPRPAPRPTVPVPQASAGSKPFQGGCALCGQWTCSCTIRGDRKDPRFGMDAPPQGSYATNSRTTGAYYPSDPSGSVPQHPMSSFGPIDPYKDTFNDFDAPYYSSPHNFASNTTSQPEELNMGTVSSPP